MRPTAQRQFYKELKVWGISTLTPPVGTKGVNPALDVKHFIDRNRVALIGRMSDTNIMLVLDELLSEEILNDVQYNTVQSCKTSHKMMRKIYDYARSWGFKQKERFFSFLLMYENCLIMELMEQENHSLNSAQ